MSGLLQAGGFTVTRLPSPLARAALAREAARAHERSGEVVRVAQSSDREMASGSPARWLEMAQGGTAMAALYRAPSVEATLRRLTGHAWQPSGGVGSYLYYRRPGHFLGLHRDVEGCELAVIACVYDEGAPSDERSGALSLWPSRAEEPIASIGAEPHVGRIDLRVRPGEAVVLLGRLVPHAVEPVHDGHVRIVAPLCYRPA